MRKLAIFLLFAFTPLFGQATTGANLSVSSNPVVAAVGAPITITISLVSGGGPAGLQWDMSGMPTGAAVASLVAGKTASCTATRCLLVGTTATAIPDGPIATIKGTQPTGGTLTATILATMGATPAGSLLTVAAPAPLAIPVPVNCDLNQDGKVDQTDVGLSIQQALASPTTVSIVQVVQEIIAANGGACLR